MLFKNKHLPLQNTELNEEEVRYLIKKIKDWLDLMLYTRFFNFGNQSVATFLSKQKYSKKDHEAVYERLSSIRWNLMDEIIFKEKVILSDDNFILINSVYKRIRFLFFIP